MRLRSSRLAMRALAVLGWLLTAAPLHAGPASPEIRGEIRRVGSMRVIVELRDPAFAPGALRRAAVRRDDRRLSHTRGRVEALLSWRARSGMRRLADLPLLAVEPDAADLARLEASPDVVAVHADRLYRPALDASVPQIGGDLTTAARFDGQGAAIAILDTGVDGGHPAFAGRIVAEACFSQGGDCPGGATSLVGSGAAAPCSYSQTCFHGTHVAGIAAGSDATYSGVAPAADLVAIQIFSSFSGATHCSPDDDPCPLAYTSDIISGLAFARTLPGVPVVAANLSLGGDRFTSQAACDADDPAMTAEFAALWAAGVAPVAAAGNDAFTNALSSPACISGAVSVGSIDLGSAVSATSNSASFLSLLAPGVNVRSALPPALFGGSLFGNSSGTSMATPHVAGAVAALASATGGASVQALVQALLDTGPLVTDPKSGLATPSLRVDLATAALAPGPCFNGLDDDGDGQVDFPADPGCEHGLWPLEAPACDDGLDNDLDGALDFAGGASGEPPDGDCLAASDLTEGGAACGLGPELALGLPLLAALRRRRRA